jgi:hypothetical protein
VALPEAVFSLKLRNGPLREEIDFQGPDNAEGILRMDPRGGIGIKPLEFLMKAVLPQGLGPVA